MNLTDFSDIHTHNLAAGSDSIINLPLRAELPDRGYFSVGLHPWDTAMTTEADMAAIERIAEDPRVVAIGETGIDKLRGGDLDKQLDILNRHISLSERLGKPLILHIVRAYPEIIQLRKNIHPTQRWIIHGFRGKPELAHELLRNGFDISLGQVFNPATAAVIPPDRLFHESD